MYRIIKHKSVIFSECVPNVCLVLNSVVSSLSDRSKYFTLYSLRYLFIPTHIWLLLEAFSHSAITMRRLHSPDSCFLPHSVSWYVVCRLYSVGALLHNCMTTVMICFNLRYLIFRGALEQQCIRYLTPNVFDSGPIATLKIYD